MYREKNQVWWCILVTPVFKRLMQEDQNCKIMGWQNSSRNRAPIKQYET
jgi:hypothetical protein